MQISEIKCMDDYFKGLRQLTSDLLLKFRKKILYLGLQLQIFVYTQNINLSVAIHIKYFTTK